MCYVLNSEGNSSLVFHGPLPIWQDPASLKFEHTQKSSLPFTASYTLVTFYETSRQFSVDLYSQLSQNQHGRLNDIGLHIEQKDSYLPNSKTTLSLPLPF